MAKELQPGDPAPDLDLPADGGGRARLADYAGRILVLYFYPKDDTEGCTKQAIGFTEKLGAFRKAGSDVLGVSKDSPAKHDKFKAKHRLGVTLASDEDGAVCEAYGVWKEKTLYGRKYMGVERSTFLIGPDGRILRIWRAVRVPGHVDQVLDAVREGA
jgi:peroxiredoxin Q/BCP